MNRLSVCIITLNEEENLPRALASLQEIADEIVVVDSGSTDRTPEIAREYGACWFERAWSNYADQQNYAIFSGACTGATRRNFSVRYTNPCVMPARSAG